MPGPKKVRAANFAVTYLCNSQCRTCNIWKKYNQNTKAAENELTLEEIKSTFNSKYLRQLENIGLTGGEPFLREDFVNLCGFFIEKYPDAGIGIPTNAAEPDLIIKKLEKILDNFRPKNLSISVALDGIEETHDKLRGIHGNYENALRLIDMIKEKLPSVDLCIDFTIIPENYKDLLEVHNLSKNKNIGFGCQFGQISDCYYDNSEKRLKEFKWDEGKLGETEKLIEIIRKEMKNAKKLDPFSEYYFLNIIDFQRNQKRKINCYSGTHSFFLDPYGDVFPCIMLNRKIGNVKDGFDRIWMSDEVKQIRKFIKNKKCVCWTPCEAFPSILRNLKVVFSNFFRTLQSK